MSLSLNCKNCGAPLLKHSEKCIYCGTPVYRENEIIHTIKYDTSPVDCSAMPIYPTIDKLISKVQIPDSIYQSRLPKEEVDNYIKELLVEGMYEELKKYMIIHEEYEPRSRESIYYGMLKVGK